MRPNQRTIREIKESFLRREPVDVSPIRPEVVESWRRCRQMELPWNMAGMPDSTLDPNTRANILQRTITMSQKYQWSWENNVSLLEELGGALFCLDENLSAYVRGGSQALLQELKEKNIKFSSCFQEHLMGTNAASLSLELGKPVWLVGEENYAAPLKDYACYGYAEKNFLPSTDVFSITDNMMMSAIYVLPLDKYTPLNKKIVESLQVYKNYQRYFQTSPEQYTKEQLLNDFGALLITDKDGVITCANRPYCEAFSANAEDLLGYTAEEKSPHLAPYIASALSGKKTRAATILLGNLKKELFVDCYPVRRGNKIIGTSTKVSQAETVKKNINRHIAYNARFTFDDIIGKCHSMQYIKNLAKTAAAGGSTVLITGESGTGKELFAQAIHNASSRSNKPFIAINCAAIPRELVGSELFGYIEGAFTGAKRSGAMGKFELANTGTIFLDEISEMPLDMQSALLRVLEERTVTRIGDSLPRPVDVRVIAASNRNLLQYVEEKKFRLDLYYRLNVIHLDIPPLRERIDDLPLLIQRIQEQVSGGSYAIVPEAMQHLQEYEWPGNVRELRNVMERCINIAQGEQIQVADLPPEILRQAPAAQPRYSRPTLQPPASYNNYKDYERAALTELLKKHNGNKTAVAEEMGISRGKLYRMLEKYDLEF